MTTHKQNYTGIFAVIFASIIWGTTGTAATFAPEVSPLGIASVAIGIGGLLQALLALTDIRKHKQALIASRKLLLFGALNVAIYPLAFYSSMKLAGVAIGTVISIGVAPIAAALIERIVEKKSISPKWMLSIVIGLLGVLLLATAKSKGNVTGQSAWEHILGVVLGVVSAVTYTLYAWVAHKIIHRGVPSRAVMGSMFGIGASLLIPVLFLTGAPLLNSATNISVGLYMAIIPMFLGYILFGIGLSSIPVSLATTITLLEPVVAAILAVTIVGEQLSAVGWIGIAMISICLLIATLGKSTTPTKKTQPQVLLNPQE